MARIRSIKPDFWKSETIAALPKATRLTFIGLWTYVDDNGVGVDSYKLIAAELYGLEDDPREARMDTREDLARLAAAGVITRYTVAGKRYMRITNWDEHQKIDRPGKARYPLPSSPAAQVHDPAQAAEMDGLLPAEPVNSRDPRESVARVHLPEKGSREQGEGEKGSRGVPPTAGDADAPATPRAELVIVPDPGPEPRTAQELVGWWIDQCRIRPPRNVVGQMAKQIGALVDEGIDPLHIRQGIAEWTTKDVNPSVLPSLVNSAMNRRPRAAPARPSTTDQRVAAALSLDLSQPPAWEIAR